MGGATKWNGVVKCPFYKEVEGRVVKCEGVNERTAILLRFANKGEMDAYMERYCAEMEGFKACRIHRMLTDKWGDGR